MCANRRASFAYRPALLVTLCLLPIACGSGKVRVYPVSGEVFVNGKPAQGALIHLHPRDRENCPPAFAAVQADGYFQITTFSSNDGAAAGDYAVTITWNDERREDGETIYSADKLGDLYSKAETSGLVASVKSGKNELPRFDLK